MSDPFTTSALRELVSRGLIVAEPAPQPLSAGNADRHDAADRTYWRVGLPDGQTARLILGTGLAGLAERQSALAHACPGLIAAPVFHQPLASGEAFADLFFAGRPLESIAASSPDAARAGFDLVCTGLAATSRPSTESARAAEWQAWTASVESLGFWTPVEKQLLRSLVWPRLAPLLCATPPLTRWTNGDFTSSNILIDAAGDARLIDCEFAAATHFFAEAAVRFHLFSPTARQRPDLYVTALPPAGPAWHLFFWLRQLALEATHNSAAYFARIHDLRLGVIRRLSEQILDCRLTGWSVEATPVHHTLEVARWAQTSRAALRLSGWCHVPSAATLRSVVVSEGDRLPAESAATARPDVQAHFAGAGSALNTGYDLAVPLREADATLVLSAVTDDGTLLPFHTLRSGDLPGRGPWVDDYPRWAAQHDPDPLPGAAAPPGPVFSVLLPVYRTPPAFLRECLASVQAQHHAHWELLVVDDGSDDPGLAAMLREVAASDPRIRLVPRASNGGIARATNDALAMAAGEFIVLLDHDDLLRPHALAELAARLRLEPDLDAVYSDEDKITADGRRLCPMLKPGFSPEFLLGVMYVGHVLCVRTSVARAAGGFDPAFDGVQDYEFFLRVTERTRRIGHVPKILYHWRQSPGSSSLHGNVKGDMDQKQAAAVQAHLLRRNDARQAHPLGGHRVGIRTPTPPATGIVPCAPGDDPVVALHRAARTSTAEILVLLQIDPPAGNNDWWHELAGLAARPDSGCVAPVLLSREGRVLESGWTVGAGNAVPLMRGFDPAGDGYNGSLCCNREVAIVSPLCVAIRRELMQANGTDPADWLDFCTGLQRRGFFHRVCATVQVPTDHSWRADRRIACAGENCDAYFNPHFDPIRADYRLRTPGTAGAVWHLDTPIAERLADGNLELRGWCFLPDATGLSVRINVAGLVWSTGCHLPRPDVAAAHPGQTDGRCGFAARLRVPPGGHELRLEAVAPGGFCEVLLRRDFKVPRTAALHRWLWATPASRLAFQLMAGPSQAARPLPPAGLAPRSAATASWPSLAVVTPSYQQARYLGETMRSVLAQPDVACDYVVQDGGSTDGSVELIRKIANELQGAGSKEPVAHRAKLVTWESAPDDGQADAIARGFVRTSGGPDDIMAWINSDDFYVPGALAFVADYFARHPDVDVLYGHRIVVDEESREIGRWFLPKHDDEILRLNDFVPQETLFWRRRIWDKVGGIDSSFKFALDWDLLLRFQAAGAKIVRVPYFLACFRIHAAQKTSAAMHDVGQKEIDLLRTRTQGREIPPAELESDPRLIRYLRRSAFIEFLWKLGLRAP